MTKRAKGVVAAIGALALVTSGCSAGQSDAAKNGDRIPVVASTNAWGSVVSAVGGELVSVKAIIDDPNGDPHSYESTAEDGLDFAEAGLAIYNGGGYDDFAAQLAKQTEDVPAIDAFELSGHGGDEPAGEHADDEHGHDEHAKEDEHGHEHGSANEHVWYDLDTVAMVADEVAEHLGKLRPKHAKTFTANAEKFTAELEKVHKQLAAVGKGKGEIDVVATEPVAHYLLEAAGVHNVTPKAFSDAIEGDTDVPVAAQDAVNKLIEGKRVAALINNPQTETPVTKQLIAAAKQAGVPVVDMTETLPAGVSDYLTWIRAEVNRLGAALEK